MERVEVELFTSPGNNAVVRMPGRRFPGVIVQGDSLSALAQDATDIAVALAGTGLPAAEEAQFLATDLLDLLDAYTLVLEANDIPLPFSPHPSEMRRRLG